MRCCNVKVIGFTTLLVVVGLMVIAGTVNYSTHPPEGHVSVQPEAVPSDNPVPTGQRGAFNANVRIYVTEIVSRYADSDGYKYHYGFLGYALNMNLLMGYEETYQDTVQWDGPSHGFHDLQENNMMVFAAVFDNDSVEVDPAGGYSFWAELAVASAAATTTETWPDTAVDGYTHNIFCEELTATW